MDMAQRSTDDLVLEDLDGDGVLVLTLNRPERRNSWSPDLEHRFYAALDHAEDDVNVKVIVVTGTGRHFCPGVDMQRLDSLAGKPLDLSDRRPFHRTMDVSKPMVAAINGTCAGVGIILALMCDVRIASTQARFATSFARRGLPAERGVSWLLTRIVGSATAFDLLLSGRPFDAAEAYQLGVATRLVEQDDIVSAARAYAGELARECSPQAMAVIKRQLRDDLQSDFMTSYNRSMLAVHRLAESADFREGIDSFMQKRAPRFPGLDKDFRADVILGE